MSAKRRFRPVITRIKLNPEQAVLACSCFSAGVVLGTVINMNSSNTVWASHCQLSPKASNIRTICDAASGIAVCYVPVASAVSS